MKRFCTFNAAPGQVTSWGSCSDDNFASRVAAGDFILEATAEQQLAAVRAVQEGNPDPFTITLDGDQPVLTEAVIAQEVLDAAALVRAKTSLMGDLQAYFTSRINLGITVNGKAYQIDESSRSAITSAFIIADQASRGIGTWPDGGFPWIATDNTITLFATSADFIAFGQAVAGYCGALALYARALKDAIIALPDAAACAAFDVTQGWPA